MFAVYGIAIAAFVLHVFCNNRYGYFRDEFDYIACGRHPGWGYVDQPSLLPILSRLCLAMFGDSLRSVRFVPAITCAALIVLAGIIARELGGKRFAVVLSAVTILIAPIYVSGGSLLTSNCDLEQLFEHVEYIGNSAPNPYALENEISVHICRGAKFGTLADLWPKIKRWR